MKSSFRLLQRFAIILALPLAIPMIQINHLKNPNKLVIVVGMSKFKCKCIYILIKHSFFFLDHLFMKLISEMNVNKQDVLIVFVNIKRMLQRSIKSVTKLENLVNASFLLTMIPYDMISVIIIVNLFIHFFMMVARIVPSLQTKYQIIKCRKKLHLLLLNVKVQ